MADDLETPLGIEDAVNAVGKDNLLAAKKSPDANQDEEGIENLKSRGSSGDIQEPDEVDEKAPLIR